MGRAHARVMTCARICMYNIHKYSVVKSCIKEAEVYVSHLLK